GILGRRPGDPGLRVPRRELVEAEQPARRRAQRLEPVERRDARARLLDVDPRPGEDDAGARRADGDPEPEALLGDARRLGRERGRVERGALRVEEERVLDDLPREELLREPGDEDHVEREAARGLDRGDEDRAVAPPGWWNRQLAQPGAED